MNKILLDTKVLLGIPEEAKEFDPQLIIHINATFMTLNQLGVGPTIAYQTTSSSGDLETFLPDNPGLRDLVQMYLYIAVRLVFDPPSSSIVLGALQKAKDEYEWRLMNPTT